MRSNRVYAGDGIHASSLQSQAASVAYLGRGGIGRIAKPEAPEPKKPRPVTIRRFSFQDPT